ncbi:hypothetical protein JMJ77_0003340 [Colletotrichum scovillei]|uniref:Uncharacterized protein n=1 Tax=Colletotrichum scovillei TaxID=1209932 RepID=A0A9P7QXW7_9PEZI|nr:hypothetical protein JMJ78_0006559 [Colletotrichum scovillei]KAG7043638.1 hypothetical protein JMJ77_0003340 [Colletotrichum scovillei]KAG7063087.1 hypothetical protein JMJ76_0009925 [Colletotrichum scovillei]
MFHQATHPHLHEGSTAKQAESLLT